MTPDGVRWHPPALSAFADTVARLHTTHFDGGAADPRTLLAHTTAPAPDAATRPAAFTTDLQRTHDDICGQFAARLSALSDALLDLVERARATSRAMTAADETAAARLARLRRPAPRTTGAGLPHTTNGRAPTEHPTPQRLSRTTPTDHPIDHARSATAARPTLPPPSTPPGVAGPHNPVPDHRPASPSIAAPITDTTAHHPVPPISAAAAIPATLAAAAAAASCAPDPVEPHNLSRPAPSPSPPPRGDEACTATPGTDPAHDPREGQPTPARPPRRKAHEPRRTSAQTPTAVATAAPVPPPSTSDRRNAAPKAPTTTTPPPDPAARLTALADEFPAARAALLAARHLLAGQP